MAHGGLVDFVNVDALRKMTSNKRIIAPQFNMLFMIVFELKGF